MSAHRRHHVTGSGTDGFLDPELNIDLSPSDHDEVHRLLRGADLDDPGALLPGPPPVARVELRLRRLAVTLCVVGERLGGLIGSFLVSLSAAAERWAEELAEWLCGWSS
jgi:hypothetical protein